MKARFIQFLLVLILLLAGAVPFIVGLRAPFFYDDYNTIVWNRSVQEEKEPGRFFFQPESFSAQKVPMFRPLVVLSYWWNWKWFGEDTLGWRVVNLFFHLLCLMLAYLLVQELSGSVELGFFTALLFALHPSRVVPVIYLSARSELLASFFYLLSFWLFLRAMKLKSGQGIFFGVLSVLGFGLGLASKSIVITLPAVLTLERLFFRRWDKKSLIWLGIFWAGALGYFFLRQFFELYTFFPLARPRPVGENLLLQARVLVYYLRWLIFPLHPVVEAKFSPLNYWSAGLSIGFLSLLGGVSIYWFIRRRIEGFFLLWFFVLLAPSSSVVPLVVEASLTRCYLAGLGIFFLFARGFLGLAMIGSLLRRILAISSFGLVGLCFLVLSFNWSEKWNSPTQLWKETLKCFFSHSRAHNNLGLLLKKQGNFSQAEREFFWAIHFNPKNSSALNNYAQLLWAKGDDERAESYFIKSLSADPDNCSARLAYAEFLFRKGRIEQAGELILGIDFCPLHQNELWELKKEINQALSVQEK